LVLGVSASLLVLFAAVAVIAFFVIPRPKPVPPMTELKRFYDQTLSWSGCSSFAKTPGDEKAYADPSLQCAYLTVPLDYANPNGREIKVGLLRRPASGPAKRIGSLVINPGGPGESGMSYVASPAFKIEDNGVRQRFDLVGFDPRGVGSSEPQVVCLTPAERDAERQMNLGVDTSPAGIAKTETQEKADNDGCLSRTGKDVLANIGTRDVARDLDIMRSALKDEKLTYLGYADGSLIGTGYAEAFPGKVRAMILDNPVDPEDDWTARQSAGGQVQRQGFDAFAEWCAEQKNTDCALGSDTSKAVSRFQELVRPLIDKPASGKDGRRLSYDDAVSGTIALLGVPEGWENLNSGLRELNQGDGSVLMGFADIFYGRSKNDTYSNVWDARLSILCVDYPSIAGPNDARRREVDPFSDTGTKLSPARDNCAFWPVPPTRKPGSPRTSGLPPVLVIATTKDHSVGYESGKKLVHEINARLLTFESSQPFPFLRVHNNCIDQAGIGYLTTLQLPAEDARCQEAH
jgi:pimeloyl-ACP methyl ester carboxylesterase